MVTYFNFYFFLALSFIYIPIFIILKFKFNKKNTYLFFSSIMFIYISIVLANTFPKHMVGIRANYYDHFHYYIFNSLNLVPLITLEHRDLEFSILNIILTMPFGFLLSFLKPINCKQSIIYGFYFSFFIEFTQFIAPFFGFSFRVVDVNDLIFNTLGSFLGFLCFKLFISIFKFLINKFKIELNPLLLHIYQAEA